MAKITTGESLYSIDAPAGQLGCHVVFADGLNLLCVGHSPTLVNSYDIYGVTTSLG